MKAISHKALGKMLERRYLQGVTRSKRRAFAIGCLQPDRNPISYIKGSVRAKWLHGHNWGNSRRMMSRFLSRLEKKHTLSIWDYYTLGKLIHYTADAFTYVHNSHCRKGIQFHREYEKALQSHFLKKVDHFVPTITEPASSFFDTLSLLHRQYVKLPPNIETDTVYCLNACCMLLSGVFSRKQAAEYVDS